MTDYSFGTGKIIAVDPQAVDYLGNSLPTIHVQSDEDGGLLAIPLTHPLFAQYMPVVGMLVFYVRRGTHWTRAVTMWGTGELLSRQGLWALNEGEFFIQAPRGLAYIKADQNGKLTMVCGDTTSVYEIGPEGVTLTTLSVNFSTTSGVVLQMSETGELTLLRQDSNGKVRASIKMDSRDNIVCEAQGDVSIKAKNIYLDGNISVGPGATDPTQRAKFGNVTTSGPFGTYPTDYTTGGPIPGSQTFKASS